MLAQMNGIRLNYIWISLKTLVEVGVLVKHIDSSPTYNSNLVHVQRPENDKLCHFPSEQNTIHTNYTSSPLRKWIQLLEASLCGC